MRITHKMTSQDKLREILRVTSLKQKDLAGKFNVSEKTISFWINNKKRPSAKKEAEISAFYNISVTKEKGESDIQKIIRDYQSRNGLDEIDKVLTNNEKNYFDAKCYVLAEEKNNISRIYIFPSIGKNNDGWYKVGGRSLLFYKNLVAPRLGREAKIRDDNDKVHQFRNGIASIRWGERLIEEAKTLGYEAEIIKYGIIVIDLGREFSENEIRTMVNAMSEEKRKVQKMIRPKENYPDLMGAMNKLVKVLPSKIKKLDGSYRETLGKELLTPMVELLKIYYRFANGRMEKRDAKLEMLERTDDISAMIYMMDECGMLNITARTRLGENVVEIRKEVEKISL